MRIQRSARTRDFTVLGNDVLRNRSLSFTARGLLAFLLSLPDGARENVRTLADNHPKLGRRGIAMALDELVEHGYYVRDTVRDEETGQVRTHTYVFDRPHPDGSPLPAVPGTGERGDGAPGTSPQGGKNRREEPSLPAPATAAAPGPAAALLARVVRGEPRLALSTADVLALAPLAVPWLERGVPEPETRALLADGLPPVVHSARALLANRLRRKLPTQRAATTRRDPAAPAAPPPECARCRDPLPRGQHTGICARCTGAVPAPREPVPAGQAVADHVAAIRASLRARPPLTAAEAGPVRRRRGRR